MRHATQEQAERFELAKDDPFVVLPYFTILHVDGCEFLPTLTHPEGGDRWVYFIQPVAGGPIKVGTAKSIKNRFGYIQGSHWQELRVLGHFWGNTALEVAIHRRFRAKALRHEWFEDHPELHAALRYYLANSPKPAEVTLMGRAKADFQNREYLKRQAKVERSRMKREAWRAAQKAAA